jgi:hypothetical protein
VFGGTYMLGRPVGAIDWSPTGPPDEETETPPSAVNSEPYPPLRVVVGAQTVRAKWLIASPSYLPHTRPSTSSAEARAVVVLASPVSLPPPKAAAPRFFETPEGSAAQPPEPQDTGLVVFPPRSHGHENPVHVLQLGGGTFSCPQDQCRVR